MPAITKRKRVAPASQKNTIQKFGKISKSQPAQAALIKELALQQDSKSIILQSSSKPKRKADTLDEDENVPHTRSEVPATPRKKARCIRSNVADTPTRGARSLFQAFSITAEPSNDTAQLPTPPSSQDPEDRQALPTELQQMIDLHSCFLTALSLHYAHNGIMAPTDLRMLCPNVSRAWKVRKVEQKDVQRLLPLQSSKASQHDVLKMTDYGHGKICVELVAQNDKRKPIDEKILNARFVENLETAWRNATSSKNEVSPTAFIATLPLAPIKLISSVTKVAATLSKGQQRLTEMKAGAIKAQERASSISLGNTANSNSAKPRSKDPFERSMDLKSRIFAKQQLNAGLPAALTPEQMAHRSALMRVTEIAPVLESLALGRQRHRNDDADDDPFKRVMSTVSFTMPTLLQNLQMSLRNPVDKTEGGKCVRLLAELVPEWVGIKEIGSITGVTVGSRGVGKAVLARRVEDALSRIWLGETHMGIEP